MFLSFFRNNLKSAIVKNVKICFTPPWFFYILGCCRLRRRMTTSRAICSLFFSHSRTITYTILGFRCIPFIFWSEAPLQLTLSVGLFVCTPSALLYMEIVYIIHNDSLLILGNEPSPPLPFPLLIYIIYLFRFCRKKKSGVGTGAAKKFAGSPALPRPP